MIFGIQQSAVSKLRQLHQIGEVGNETACGLSNYYWTIVVQIIIKDVVKKCCSLGHRVHCKIITVCHV